MLRQVMNRNWLLYCLFAVMVIQGVNHRLVAVKTMNTIREAPNLLVKDALSNSQHDLYVVQMGHRYYENMAKVFPGTPLIYGVLGYTHFLTDNLEQAIRNMERLNDMMPGNYPSQHNLGRMYFLAGRYKESYDILNKALALKPSDVIQSMRRIIDPYETLLKTQPEGSREKKIYALRWSYFCSGIDFLKSATYMGESSDGLSYAATITPMNQGQMEYLRQWVQWSRDVQSRERLVMDVPAVEEDVCPGVLYFEPPVFEGMTEDGRKYLRM